MCIRDRMMTCRSIGPDHKINTFSEKLLNTLNYDRGIFRASKIGVSRDCFNKGTLTCNLFEIFNKLRVILDVIYLSLIHIWISERLYFNSKSKWTTLRCWFRRPQQF